MTAAGAGPAGESPQPSPALEVSGLSCRFGALFAVRDVSLSVPAGARFGVIGPNGAGKTTLFNLLSGELRPAAGTVRLHGRDVTRLSPPRRAALGLGRTFQITRLFTDLTVRENLTLAVHGLTRAKLQPLRPWRTYRKEQQRAADLAGSFGLGNRLEHKPSELSHGELRELEVLLALAAEPTVLLLDEPAAGLSPAERVDIQRLIRRLDPSLTLIVIEHDMNVLREVVGWIAVLHYGELVVDRVGEIIAELREQGLAIFLVEQNYSLAIRSADTVSILANGVVVWRGAPAELDSDPGTREAHLGVLPGPAETADVQCG